MQRLRRRTDIHRLFREGRRHCSPWAVLHCRQRRPDEGTGGGARLAVIAGRRFRGSVTRNRARRLLREACRAALQEAQGPWDLALVARPEVLKSRYPDRVATISRALRDSGVLSEKAGCTP